MGGICIVKRLVGLVNAGGMISTPASSVALIKSSFPATNRSLSALQFLRSLSSSSDHSSTVPIKSEADFNSSIKNVQDKSLPAIFYFTAVWCGPCKFISPILAEESKKYPDVTTYKIDIDEEGLKNVLRQLYITAVPTLHFFQNGKKAAEIVGADIQRVKDTMDDLYGKD